MTRTATARATAPRTSSARTTPRPTPRAARRPQRPPLQLVAPAPWRPPVAPFVLLALVVVAGGLLGLLALNTVVGQDAFAVHELERRSAQLEEQERLLQEEVAQLESPASIAERAQQLGLGPGGAPVFLRPDGAVLGGVAATDMVVP